MYRFYRFFARRGHGADLIHTLSALPTGLLERIGLIFVPANHR